MLAAPAALLLALPVGAAYAQQVELRDPGTLSGEWTEDIQGGSSESARSFLAFVGNGVIEQAFTLQHAPLLSSALTQGASGLSVGLELDTFPLRSPPVNGQGKEENTRFLPVVPRITAAWTAGDQLRYGVGTSLIPPVEVGGASALILGLDASVSAPIAPWVRVGIEADVTSGQAYAPVVATPEARESGELENVDEERYEAICVPQEFGCTDVLLLRHGGLHAGAAFPVSAAVQPWVRVGARYVDDRFRIEVDLSEWRVYGVLPDVSLGTNLQAGERVSVGLGAMAAPLREAVRQNGEPPLLYRLSAGVTWAGG